MERFRKSIPHIKKVLKEEIGVEPALDTRLFYQDIHNQQKNSLRINQISLAPTNISAHQSRFIGRENELDEITNLLVDPACRLITMHGPGGIGKTSLAIALARQQLGVYADGVFLISVAGMHSLDEFAIAMIEAIQVPLMESDTVCSRLLEFLRSKTMLLILDNFEHLLHDNEIISILVEIMGNSTKIKFLVTSRERMNLIEEWVYPIKGLSYPVQFDQDAPDVCTQI